MFAPRMGADQFRIALAIRLCAPIDWTKTAIQDGFVSYDFTNGQVLYLEEVVVPAVGPPRGATLTPRPANLPATHFVYRVGVSRVT